MGGSKAPRDRASEEGHWRARPSLDARALVTAQLDTCSAEPSPSSTASKEVFPLSQPATANSTWPAATSPSPRSAVWSRRAPQHAGPLSQRHQRVFLYRK